MLSKRSLSIAGSIIVLITASLFWYANTWYNNAELVQNNLKEPNFSEIQTEGSTELLKLAADAYYQSQYHKVIELLERLPPNVPGYLDFRIMLGHAFLKNNRPKAAEEVFNGIVERKEEIWKENAEWHRILASVLAGNDLEAIHYLDKLRKQENHAYHELAVELKSDLQSLWRSMVF